MIFKNYSEKTVRYLFLASVVVMLTTCEPWDLDRLDFLEVRTLDIEAVTAFSAKAGGRIEGLYVGRVSEHGHLWSRSNDNLQLGDMEVVSSALGGAASDGEFVSDLFPIDSNSLYYYRAYAIMEGAPFYGMVKTFRQAPIIIS